MNIKTIKIIIIFILAISILGTNTVNASDSIWQQAKDWLNLGESQRANSAINESSNEGFEELAGFLWGIGLFAILIIGVILGIRYIMSEPEQKASLKKSLIAYVVGSIVILGASGIWKLIVDILEDLAH